MKHLSEIPPTERSPEHLRETPWPMLWLCTYVAILTLGIIAPAGQIITFVKLTGIFLCALYTFWMFPKDSLLQLALIITCIADVILAIDNTLVLGVVCFLFAQITHLIRLGGQEFHRPIIIFAIFAAIAIISDMIFDYAPLMYVVCFFYIIAIITNIAVSWRWYREEAEKEHTTSGGVHRTRIAFFTFLGFAFFLCCDSCTGVSYLSLTGVFSMAFYHPANFLAWAFYYPSQILLANSSKCATIEPKEVHGR